MSTKATRLRRWVDDLDRSGRYTLSRAEAEKDRVGADRQAYDE